MQEQHIYLKIIPPPKTHDLQVYLIERHIVGGYKVERK